MNCTSPLHSGCVCCVCVRVRACWYVYVLNANAVTELDQDRLESKSSLPLVTKVLYVKSLLWVVVFLASKGSYVSFQVQRWLVVRACVSRAVELLMLTVVVVVKLL